MRRKLQTSVERSPRRWRARRPLYILAAFRINNSLLVAHLAGRLQKARSENLRVSTSFDLRIVAAFILFARSLLCFCMSPV